MPLIITLDNGLKYEHPLTDSNITLAQLLTDVYVGLHRLGQLDIDLNPAYLAYGRSENNFLFLEQRKLNTKLIVLMPEWQEKYVVKLTEVPPPSETLLTIGVCNLSLTALLHFVNHPETADEIAAETLLNTIIKDGKDACGNTAMHLRACRGVLPEVKLQRSINEKNRKSSAIVAQIEDSFENTALHLAAFYCHFNVVRVLLEAKAEVNVKNAAGMTPLHFSLVGGRRKGNQLLQFSLETVSLLLDKGADANAIDNCQRTPLIVMSGINISNKKELETVLQIFQKLINHRADLNAQDEKGNTALHYIAMAYNEFALNLIDYLISAGVNPNIKNKVGYTPFNSAHPANRKYLVKLGVKPDPTANYQSAINSLSDLWSLHLEFYVRPIIKEMRALLLSNIMNSLLERMPQVLCQIILDYTTVDEPYTKGDIKKLPEMHDGKYAWDDEVLWETVDLAYQRRQTLFNRHVQGIEESDDIKQLRETLEQSVLLCEKPINDFLQARVNKESKILPDEKKTDYGTFFSKDSQMSLPHSSPAISTPKDTKAFEQLQKLLAAAKVLKKDVDTIQKIASAKSVAEVREQIDLNLMVRELGELLKKLSDLDPSQRGESGDTIKAIQEGIGCIERLNDLDGKAVGAYHS